MKLSGSDTALRYALRDLQTVQRTLPLVKGRGNCIQAGACLGVFPQYLAQQFETVYAFEPDPMLFRHALDNAPALNIIWFNAALGLRRELVKTSCSRRDGSVRATHEGLTHVVKGGKIPTLRIDDLNLSACDLICLDVEGFEPKVIAGAAQTISRCRPVIILEVNKQVKHSGMTEEELRGMVTGFKYELRFRSHSDEVFTPC